MKQVLEPDDFAFAAAMLREWGVIMSMHPKPDSTWNGRQLTEKDVKELRDRGFRCQKIARVMEENHAK